MKKAGILLTFLGLLMLFAAAFGLGWSLYHTTTANPVLRIDVPPGKTFTSPLMTVDTRDQVQLALLFDVRTTSVQENNDGTADKWTARYSFPVHYRVLDEQGVELYTQTCNASWESCGTRSITDAQLDSRGGAISVEHGFDTFRPAPPGRIRVEVSIDKDGRYGAVAERIELLVYDKVVGYTAAILGSVALLLFAPIILITGVLLLVVPAFNNNPLPTGTVEPALRTWAMLAHLAALLGYVGIPFGQILGPLIVWLSKKDEDPFIDAHGRESLNFQISMTLYMIIAFVLILVFIGIILLFVLIALHIALSIIAALRANQGQLYRYPFTIRFLQPAAEQG
jgi:hypothetical protein